MLKEFIQHIQETTKPYIEDLDDGSRLIVRPNAKAEEFRPTIDHPDTLPLNSLDALVKMVVTEALPVTKANNVPLYITIPSPLKVQCFTHPNYAARYFRQFFYAADATDVPGWAEKVTLGFEEAQIALRTRFQETPDTLYAMKLLSDISLGAKVVYNDNGIATTVTTQKGVALQTNEQIRPLIKLRPYRTFQEVDQPESLFLIRLNDRGITFTEADGGMWKLAARQTIKKFLENALEAEIAAGEVYIAL
ncbi:hypothetical protein [uncultured Dysosmobacter sp.]|uniref:hypothetical protein n=1 Tax=uncultured Dysosmobacter sp. TaxID=2591384 RepID=UPI002637F796|nr:hypothetical protein [uncultured Dysosmobacter sp.]